MLLSFCATNLNTADRIPSSLGSIDRIAQRLGFAYEIVVAEGPSTDGATALLAKLAQEMPLRVVVHEQRNRGYGRRKAFEASRGDIIIPFDTSLEYDPLLADVLRRYLAHPPYRLLVSELLALPRSAIQEAGGWRDLVGGEDIDLYARVIGRIGLLAYPIASAITRSARLSSYRRQMRYLKTGWGGRLRRIYSVQRDQMIGANFTVRDLLIFNGRKPWHVRFGLALFFTLVAAGARLSPIRPVQLPSGNNYLAVREGTLRSLIAHEADQLVGSGPAARFLLTEDEVHYLAHRTPQSRALLEAARPFIETH